jgi:hypothetical protein
VNTSLNVINIGTTKFSMSIFINNVKPRLFDRQIKLVSFDGDVNSKQAGKQRMSQYTMRLLPALNATCGRIGTYLLLKVDLDDDWWGLRADGDASVLRDNGASENKFFQSQSNLYMFLMESFQKHNFMELQSYSYDAVRKRLIEVTFADASSPLPADSLTVRFLLYATLCIGS